MLYVPLAFVDDNPFQPRQYYDEAEVEALARSIAASTMLQAPTARLVYAEDGTLAEDTKHKLIRVVKDVGAFLDENHLRVQLAFGHKRLRAMRLLDARRGEDLIGEWPRRVQWGTMPLARVEALEDLAISDAAMEENDKRSQPSAVEVAAALQLRIETFGLTQEQVGDRYGYTRAAVSNLLRLLRLPEWVQAMNRDGRLSQGKARALVPLWSLEGRGEEIARGLDAGTITYRGSESGTRDGIATGAPGLRTSDAVRRVVERYLDLVGAVALQERMKQEPELPLAPEATEAEVTTQADSGGIEHVVRETNRLVAVYNTADSWRTGREGGRPEDVSRETIEATLATLTAALEAAWVLFNEVSDAGLDPKTTPEGRWNVDRLCERLQADVETYTAELERKTPPEATAEPDTPTPVVGEGVSEKAGSAHLEDPAVTRGPRVRWTSDGWPFEPHIDAFHALGGMTKPQLENVVREHDVDERERYGRQFYSSGDKAHYRTVAEEVTRYHANLKASLRLRWEQAAELYRWACVHYANAGASDPVWTLIREGQTVSLRVGLQSEMWAGYVDVQARRVGAFCYHVFLRETEGTRTRYPVVSADTSTPEAPGVAASGDDFDAPAYVTGEAATNAQGHVYHERGTSTASAPIATCQYESVTAAVEAWIGRRKGRTLADVTLALSDGRLVVDRVTPEGIERLTSAEVLTALGGGIVAAIEDAQPVDA